MSEKGFNVLLLDKDEFPRDKPCGGGIPHRVIRRFPYLQNKKLIDNTVFGGIAHTPDLKNEVKLERDTPIGATVLRKEFDYGLIRIAEEHGTFFKEKSLVKDLKINQEKVKLVLKDNTTIDSEIVIGSDGIWSTVAKKSGLIKTRKNIGMCILEEHKINRTTLDKHFGEKRISHIFMKFQGINGYGWIFPKSEHLNLGICVFTLNMEDSLKKVNLVEIYKQYLKILKESNLLPECFISKNTKRGQFPLYPIKKTYADRVVICGDAAGFINPFTGEGIYYAMVSGKIAADIISKSLKSGNTDESFLSRYEKAWKKDFGRDIKQYFQIGKKQKKRANKMVDIIKKDKIFADIILGVLLGDKSVYEYRWKLRKRFLYVSLKEFFKGL